MPDVIHPDRDCEICHSFVDGLEALPMDGVAWLQRDKLKIVFIWHHHVPMFDELRARVMIQGLRDGGWPSSTLRRVAELVVDVGL